MKPSYFSYWGKACADITDSKRYHLLVYHCLEVAAVGYELIVSHPRCIQITESLNIEQKEFANLFAFCLCLHDLGKFSSAFQSQRQNLSTELISTNSNKYAYDIKHDTLGYRLWSEKLKSFLSNDIGLSLDAEDVFDLLLKVVTGHHGNPPGYFQKPISIENYFSESDITATADFLDAMSKLFAINLLKNSSINDSFAEIKNWKIYSWLLNGLAVLADWLGSNQSYFPYCTDTIDLNIYWQQAQYKAKEAVAHAGLNHYVKAASYKDIKQLFPNLTELTPLQKACAEIELTTGPQLFILEDVTGAGKTEAALLLAQTMLGKSMANGIYIGLPTMATANGMYERLTKFYIRLYSNDSKPSLILSHSKSRLSEQFTQSLGSAWEQQPEDTAYKQDGQTASIWCNRWFADNRKKALLADVGVGTLDQALLSVLPVRHQTLRLLGLQGKILIADEIHAYDSYTSKLLAALIQTHTQFGGSTILLSATMTKKLRTDLMSAFYKGLDPSPSIQQPKLTDFPLLTHIQKSSSQSEIVLAEKPVAARDICKKTVKIEFLSSQAAIYALITKATAAGKCVCWIRNTVRDARDAFKEITQLPTIDANKAMLFHSRFTMIDRLAIEKKVSDYFGKDSTAAKRAGRVLIATQVVEQSLDLDFDILISDLAPIDLLIQRLGRLHRHQRDIDGNLIFKDETYIPRETPIGYIYGPTPNDTPDKNWLKNILPGTQAVYADVSILWLTQQILLHTGKITMPDQARFLLEGVYSEDNRYKEIPSSLAKFFDESCGKAMSDRSLANLNILSIKKGYCWNSADNDAWSKTIETPTRLGDEEMQEVMLAVVDGDMLRPYAADADFCWDMSSVNLNKQLANTIKEKIPDVIEAQIKQLIADTPQLKNYHYLLPLTFNTETNSYVIYDKARNILADYSDTYGFKQP